MVIILCAIGIFIIMVVAFWAVSSSVDYKIMSYTERIQSQIEDEQQVYSDAIFEKVEVIRPWYSFDPTDWSYLVKLKDDETRIYEYCDGTFIQMMDCTMKCASNAGQKE